MGDSLREVKSRIQSTKKTSQITKAMYMVSSSKVKRSQKTFDEYQDFLKNIGNLISTVLAKAGDDFTHPMLTKREIKTTAYILVSSDTGLAGPYNSNVFKYFEHFVAEEKDSNYIVGTIGRKAFNYATSKKLPIVNEHAILIRDDVMFLDIVPLAKSLLKLFEQGEIDRIVIVYNHFVNTLTQETVAKVLLPVQEVTGEKINKEFIFEGGYEVVLDKLLPMYVEACMYGIILDSKTSEHASRMNSMKSASDNAEEIIDKLQILYNRARQSAITNELIDIVAGANAVN